MAKKKKEFTYSELDGLLSSAMDKTTIMEAGDDEVKEFISTGIYSFDALISTKVIGGGIPSNRITVLAGESGVGKSFICYNIAREAQKKGYMVIYIDTEFAIQKDDLTSFGIDVENNFKLIRSNVIEDLKIMLTKTFKKLRDAKMEGREIPKIIYFLDSVGQLASRKEIDDALDGKTKQDMTRAKTLNSLWRIINSDLGYLNIPFVCTNHTYMSNDLFPKQIMKGGQGLYYSASTILFLTKKKLKGDTDELDLNQSGITITAKSVKNRMAKPKKMYFDLSFSEGANYYSGLQFFLTEDNFEQTGIAKGKMETDKKTGEEVFKPGGHRYYIHHLGKSVYEKNLYSAEIFTEDVLKALDNITRSYFSYASHDEIEEYEKKLKEAMENDKDIEDVMDLTDEDLGL